MSDVERQDFVVSMQKVAADALARGMVPATVLAAHFHLALRSHPEEEARLLALWDKLTSRQMV